MLLVLLITPLVYAVLAVASHHHIVETPKDFIGTCHKIAGQISDASQVFFPFEPQYFTDISHAVTSSTRFSACSVEPGSAEDVSIILNILKLSKTPFAVKGGGHSTNPRFSSTIGVQISMSRFNETNFNPEDGTVEIGAGLTWDQVYEALGPHNVSVVGGRVAGVGVGGLTTGGGYSYLTSQYGLAIDNIAGYELVLPNGTITNVTSNDTDLWFGLRGGLNNFGVVTKFILKSYPQGEIWGGYRFYTKDHVDEIEQALVNFQKNNDTKAAVIVSPIYVSGNLTILVSYFYDAPSPSGVFDKFLAIPSEQVGFLSSGSFSDLILNTSVLNVNNQTRLFYNSVPVTQYSPVVFKAFVNHTTFWGARLSALDSTVVVAAGLEPFASGMFSHGSPSAYPPDRSQAVFPSVIQVAWANSTLDDQMAEVLRESAKTIYDVAVADKQNLTNAAAYVNYALYGTPLQQMYGVNLQRLREIRKNIDPQRVMDLAGGFKF